MRNIVEGSEFNFPIKHSRGFKCEPTWYHQIFENIVICKWFHQNELMKKLSKRNSYENKARELMKLIGVVVLCEAAKKYSIEVALVVIE